MIDHWYYGPTLANPDPGAMWHYRCGGRVESLEGAYICSCGKVWDESGEWDD